MNSCERVPAEAIHSARFVRETAQPGVRTKPTSPRAARSRLRSDRIVWAMEPLRRGRDEGRASDPHRHSKNHRQNHERWNQAGRARGACHDLLARAGSAGWQCAAAQTSRDTSGDGVRDVGATSAGRTFGNPDRRRALGRGPNLTGCGGRPASVTGRTSSGRSALGARVARGGCAVRRRDIGAQVRRLENLDLRAPGQDPEANFDGAGDPPAPDQ